MRLGRHTLIEGDCIEAMRAMQAESVDAVVTDPPYGLGFMGKAWDALPPGEPWAREVLRVCKPGAHVVAFGGQRTIHRLTTALEDAGWEIRDQIGWLYWSGFPKSLDVSKAIDKAAGAEREIVGVHRRHGGGSANSGSMRGPLGTASDLPLTAPATDDAARWSGWGTGLKPAMEPAILARKPLTGAVAANVLEHGTGGINIDAARYAYGDPAWPGPTDAASAAARGSNGVSYSPQGRWPANVYYCPKATTAEREAGCEQLRQASAGELTGGRKEGSVGLDNPRAGAGRTSSGRGNTHPTVKPIRLMRWLVRLTTPPGGVVLDPFVGSGTTLLAAEIEGFDCIGIERDPHHCEIVRARYGARERLRVMQNGHTPSEAEAEALDAQVVLL